MNKVKHTNAGTGDAVLLFPGTTWSLVAFAILFLLLTQAGTASAQKENRDKMNRIAWLKGEWEGVGYVGTRPGNETHFNFSFKSDSGIFQIQSPLFSFGSRLDFESDYHHLDALPSGMTGVSAFFLGEEKYDNRVLTITPISEDFMHLSMAYNRRRPHEKFIFLAAMKKKR
jgi:hypothetical protein